MNWFLLWKLCIVMKFGPQINFVKIMQHEKFPYHIQNFHALQNFKCSWIQRFSSMKDRTNNDKYVFRLVALRSVWLCTNPIMSIAPYIKTVICRNWWKKIELTIIMLGYFGKKEFCIFETRGPNLIIFDNFRHIYFLLTIDSCWVIGRRIFGFFKLRNF